MTQDSFKALNVNTIYELILSRKLLTKKEIQDITSYSWGTVSGTVNRLLKNNYIQEITSEQTLPGRPPKYYRINPGKIMFIGMDISLEYIRIVITSADNQILCSDTTIIPPLKQHYIINIAIQFLSRMVEKFIPDSSAILGLGISIVFSSNRKTGIPLFPSYIKGWDTSKLIEVFQAQFSFPAAVAHTSNCLALAEFFARPHNSLSNVFFINIDLDISTSLLIEGHIHPGYEVSSEFSHIAIFDRSDSNYQCLQDVCSINGIATSYRKNNLAGGELSEEPDDNSCGNICLQLYKSAKEGDQTALSYFRKAGYFLGIGISHVLNIINPDIVILGGSFMNYADLFLGDAKKAAKQYSYKYSSANIQLAISDKYGSAVGASALFREEKPWRKLLEQIT